MSLAPGPSSESIPDEYYFITAPQDVSWSKDSKTSEIATYGTNTPYLNYGSTSLRKLKLGNSMIEGFSDGKEVESNVTQLESCMQMVIDSQSGYTSPYCWRVFAGAKSYGIFIITGVNVQEAMRDMSGKATRAFVDVDLQEVSEYQVSSGTDITSRAIVGSITQKAYDTLKPQTDGDKQEAAVKAARTPAGGNLNPGTAPRSQPNTPNNSPLPNPTPRNPQGRFGERYTNETGREVLN